MNPERFSTGLVLAFTHKRTNPKTFEFGKFCRVNAFLSNPDIFSPAIF